MKDLSVKKLTLGGVMAALVFVMTYFPKVPVPVTGGYIHLGDGVIFLSAMLLGPLSIPAAAIGSALSDLIGGYIPYVLPTLVIKGVMAWAAWKLYRDGSLLRQILAFAIAEVIMVLGYFAFECFMSGVAPAAAAIFPNVIQGIGGIILGLLCGLLVPRLEKAIK